MRNRIIKDVCAITLLLLSIAETIVMKHSASFKWYELLCRQVSFCFGVFFVRFSHFCAQIHLNNIMHKWGNSDDYDDEPNEYGILIMKLLGCGFLVVPAFMYVGAF